MLTRLFNLKKQVNEPKNKPDFFKRKDVQPYLQQITKKFPNVGPSQMSFPQIQQGESSLISELSFFNPENDFSSKTETRLLLAKVNLYTSSNSIPVYIQCTNARCNSLCIIGLTKLFHAFLSDPGQLKYSLFIFTGADEIVKQLEPYYTTFLDIKVFRDHVYECLRIIDELFMQLNIAINSHLTIGYLTLVENYVKICIMLSRVEDRKMIMGVYRYL